MADEEEALSNGKLAQQLYDFAMELMIKNDTDNAWLVTAAAARIMAIPHIATAIQHPNPKFDLEQSLRTLFGIDPEGENQ